MSPRGMPVAWVAIACTASAGCSAGVGERGVAVPAPSISNLAYAPASGAEVLDVWLPSSAPRPYPLAIFVQGGG